VFFPEFISNRKHCPQNGIEHDVIVHPPPIGLPPLFTDFLREKLDGLFVYIYHEYEPNNLTKTRKLYLESEIEVLHEASVKHLPAVRIAWTQRNVNRTERETIWTVITHFVLLLLLLFLYYWSVDC
jgi:hypothetical protein